MADAFTAANKVARTVASIDRARAVLTTREQAEQDRLRTEREIRQGDQQFEIRGNQEERAQSRFETEQARQPSIELFEQTQLLLAQELRATQSQLDKSETFNAFRRFNADGDTRHLNSLLQQNPRIKKVFGNEIASIDKIDLINDELLIQQSGLDPDIFAEEDAIKQFVKVTNADGTKDIVDMNRVFAATGYLEQLEDKELSKLERKAKIGKAQAEIVKALRETKSGKKLNLTQEATVAKFLSELDPAELEKFTKGAKLAEELFPPTVKPIKPTAAQRNIIAADKRQKKLVENFGGEEEFFKTDFSIPANRIKASSDIRAIEKLAGIELSNAEKKKIREINKLINLSGIAARELTPETTGLIDTVFSNVKKYFTDNVKGVKGRAAYAAFRNVIRHSLFGTVLTKNEIKSFNEAFGALGQQLGPVLEQLKVAVGQLQSDIDSLSSTNDPFIMHFRLGASQDKLVSISTSLEERLNALGQFQSTGALIEAEPARRVKSIEPTSKSGISKFKFSTGE